MNFIHVIVTRYNVGLYNNNSAYKNKERWMNSRLDIFKSYGLPSVLGQTCQDFIWIICFDKNTPVKHLNEIIPLLSRCNIVSLLIDSKKMKLLHPGMGNIIKEAILEFIPSTIQLLVTNNLDNDDFLDRNFVKTVHHTVKNNTNIVPYVIDPEIVYVVREKDMKLCTADCTKNKSWASPFFTLVEDRSDTLTCLYSPGHGAIRHVVPRYEILNGCCAGRVFHNSNVSRKNGGNLDGTYCGLETSRIPITNAEIARLAIMFNIDYARLVKLQDKMKQISSRAIISQ